MLKVKNIVWTLFFCLFLHYFHFSLYFCKCYLPIVAGMLTEVRRAAGWGTTYWKGVIALCFWTFETTTIEITVKNIEEVTPRGVYISGSVVCCEDTCILIGTLYGVSIYLNVDVSLSVFLWGCGRPRKSNRQMQAPTFFVCSYHMIYNPFALGVCGQL